MTSSPYECTSVCSVANAVLQSSIQKLVEGGGTIIQAASAAPFSQGLFVHPCLVEGTFLRLCSNLLLCSGVVSDDALTEIFGPVGVLLSFRTEMEALQIVNHVHLVFCLSLLNRLQASGMLLASVFSKDRESAIRVGNQVRC